MKSESCCRVSPRGLPPPFFFDTSNTSFFSLLFEVKPDGLGQLHADMDGFISGFNLSLFNLLFRLRSTISETPFFVRFHPLCLFLVLSFLLMFPPNSELFPGNVCAPPGLLKRFIACGLPEFLFIVLCSASIPSFPPLFPNQAESLTLDRGSFLPRRVRF